MTWESDMPNSPDGEPSEILTAHERDVLAMSATGLCAAEIAACLGRPAETIRRALALAMWKLRARSKLEAVVAAVRTGLIDLPDRDSAWAMTRRTDDAAS
jgi:DNA-binding NarL/FixJ family response regulator